MVVSTRRKTGKVKVVNYAEAEVEDDNPSHDIKPTPRSEEEDEYELSHGKKRKPRKPVTPTAKGKRKGKARRLDTLFDKLPTEVVYTVGYFSSPCYRQ
ncbi:hypothetical protein FRC00_008492 [Tulasnella sp. 408]|nr:hypothetical protein FRC00_008492 [Tulasnella sp. 408]